MNKRNTSSRTSPSAASGRPEAPRSAGLRERMVRWLVPDGEVAALRRQCEQHKAAAEGRWSDVYLMHAGPTGQGFEITMRAPITFLLVEHLGRMLDEVGAKNWVEVDVFHPKHGGLTLTVQRRAGKTPGDRIKELKDQLDKVQSAQPLGVEAEGPTDGQLRDVDQ